jgi:FAD:protein FMN transferase
MMRPHRRAQPWLGTLVDISIADACDDAALHAAFDAAFSAIARVHRCMSFHERDSDVSRINHARAGERVEVDVATHGVIRHALALFDESAGIFDVACAARLVEWEYLPAQGDSAAFRPSGEMIAVDADCAIRKLHAGWIDLGGIAKGHAVDAAIEALEQCGIRSACVNAGGDLRVLGTTTYEVSIRDPHDPTSIASRLSISDGALATSGAYFTRKQHGDELRSALIDGRSGVAVTRDFSVSVQAPTCMAADALTKIVAATGNANHQVLAKYDATALII